MNETIESTPAPKKKSFLQRHKVAIAVIATSTVWIALNRMALKQHNDFLKEKDLYEEFYVTEDE